LLAGAMFMVLDLVSPLIFGFGQRFGEAVLLGLLFRCVTAPVAGALLMDVRPVISPRSSAATVGTKSILAVMPPLMRSGSSGEDV